MDKEFIFNWLPVVLALMIGVWLGYGLANTSIRKNAIQNECAYYNAKTGEFKWGQPQ